MEGRFPIKVTHMIIEEAKNRKGVLCLCAPPPLFFVPHDVEGEQHALSKEVN